MEASSISGDGSGIGADAAARNADQRTDADRVEIRALAAELGEVQIKVPDGAEVSLGAYVRDLEADEQLATVLDACNIRGVA